MLSSAAASRITPSSPKESHTIRSLLKTGATSILSRTTEQLPVSHVRGNAHETFSLSLHVVSDFCLMVRTEFSKTGLLEVVWRHGDPPTEYDPIYSLGARNRKALLCHPSSRNHSSRVCR